MFNRIAKRLLSPLRTFVLALFVLGVIVQPVVASMSEIHELSHEPTGHQMLAEHLDPTEDDDGDAGSPGALHALHHFVHCCGQFTAIMTVAFDSPLPLAASGLLATGESQARSDTRALAPFRPPIAA